MIHLNEYNKMIYYVTYFFQQEKDFNKETYMNLLYFFNNDKRCQEKY